MSSANEKDIELPSHTHIRICLERARVELLRTEVFSRRPQQRKDLLRIKTLLLDIQNEKIPMLEKWSCNIESELGQLQQKDFQSYIFAYDDLSDQIVQLQAEERAFDDALKCLDEAFEKRLIPLDVFLLETRDLASTQFVKKQHLAKISKMMGK